MAEREGRKERGSWDLFPVFVQHLARPQAVCGGHSLQTVRAAVRHWGRQWKSNSYRQSLSLRLNTHGAKGTLFSSQGAPWCQATPKSTHNSHTLPPHFTTPSTCPARPRWSAELFCSFQMRKRWPAALGVPLGDGEAFTWAVELREVSMCFSTVLRTFASHTSQHCSVLNPFALLEAGRPAILEPSPVVHHREASPSLRLPIGF